MKNRLIVSTFLVFILCIQHEIHAMGGLRTYAGRAGQYARQYATNLTEKAIPTCRTFAEQARKQLYNVPQKFYNTRTWASNANWLQKPRIPSTRTTALGLGGIGLTGATYLNYLHQNPVRADEYKPEEYVPALFNAIGFRYDNNKSVSDNFNNLFNSTNDFDTVSSYIKEISSLPIARKILAENLDTIVTRARNAIQTEELKKDKNSTKIEDIKTQMANLFTKHIYDKNTLLNMKSSIMKALSEYNYIGSHSIKNQHITEQLDSKLKRYIADLKENPGLLRALLSITGYPYYTRNINDELEHTLYILGISNQNPLTDKNLIELRNLLKDEGIITLEPTEKRMAGEAKKRNNSLWYLYGYSPW